MLGIKKMASRRTSFSNIFDQVVCAFRKPKEKALAELSAAERKGTCIDISTFSGIKDSRIKRLILAYQYRTEQKMPCHEVSEDDFKTLRQIARQWKEQTGLYPQISLNDEEITRLKEACRYPDLIDLLREDHELAATFCEWVVRDGIDSAPFVEFPVMQELICKCALNGRLGVTGGKGLKISNIDGKKILTLPIQGVDTNILDENKEILFKGNYRLTIGQIFEVFANKYRDIGNLEYLEEGIVNWNCHHHGYWDADAGLYRQIDLNSCKFWEQLPTLETLTLREAKKRYGSFVNGKNWTVAVCATRATRTLDFEGTHAFLEIAIPKEHGYAIYDLGKFAYRFPVNFVERVSLFAKSLHATIAYPDENIFYTHRQFMRQPFCITEEAGMRMMEAVRADIIKGRNLDMIYQIESENCAKWAQETLRIATEDRYIPNLFYINLLKSEPQSFVRYLFTFVKLFPKSWQKPFFANLHILFGAHRGEWIEEKGVKIWKSLLTHKFFTTVDVFLPSFLCHQIEQGVLGSVIRTISDTCKKTTGFLTFSSHKSPHNLCSRTWTDRFCNTHMHCLMPRGSPLQMRMQTSLTRWSSAPACSAPQGMICCSLHLGTSLQR